MNIKRAKEEIEHTVKAYLAKDTLGEYAIPSIRQRPILLMGPPGIGKSKLEFISKTIQTHNSSHNGSKLLLEIK